ncbi:MAG: efflux RND transporter periplasmic adaptor subunit [Verrucomicrobiota bacterium]
MTLLFTTSCDKPPEPPPPIRPIVTTVVEAPGAQRERRFSGTARPAVETRLSFRVGGEILKLDVKKGITVKPGDLIAELDATDFKLQVKKDEARVAQSQSQLTQATGEYERNRSLYEKQKVSKSDLDRSRAAYESAQAQFEADRQGLEQARLQVDYCTLKAPVEGAIATVSVEAHQSIRSGDTIATLSSGQQMEFEFGAPEALINQIHVGDEASIFFEVQPDVAAPARVSEVGIDVSESTTYPVTLQLTSPQSDIRPGMIGEALFNFDTASDHGLMTVPTPAVVGRSGQTYVWIYQPESSTVTRRIIEVGSLTSRGLEILAGLKPGDRIAIRGAHRLEEGMKVRLLDRAL